MNRGRDASNDHVTDDVACSCSRCNADRRVPDDARLDLSALREVRERDDVVTQRLVEHGVSGRRWGRP